MNAPDPGRIELSDAYKFADCPLYDRLKTSKPDCVNAPHSTVQTKTLWFVLTPPPLKITISFWSHAHTNILHFTQIHSSSNLHGEPTNITARLQNVASATKNMPAEARIIPNV